MADKRSGSTKPAGGAQLHDRLAVERWINEGGRPATEAVIERELASGSPASQPDDRRRAIQRLLLVADAAVADARELPRAVRAVIDAAADLYVVTPTLPGRLAWLSDEVDAVRHVADERLDTVLGHMRSLGAHADGLAARGSVLTVIADAVREFQPDHIVIALRSSEHANWQERRLVGHIEARFGLPVTTYAVDPRGHTSPADGPLLLCYDGSEDATHAIERAGGLFCGRHALVVTVWQPPALGTLAWSGATAGMADFAGIEATAGDAGRRLADEGARIARAAGLDAEPIAVEAAGAIWTTIVELADRHDAATIVLGSRGLAGLRSLVLGSVSSAVVHHADRPTLIIREPVSIAQQR
jgi:nucleotide-binding universal stress UspA family protein